MSTRALFRLKVEHWPNSVATGFGGAAGTRSENRVAPLAEQLPTSEVALTITSIVEPGVTPVVSIVALVPRPLIEPADVVHL